MSMLNNKMWSISELVEIVPVKSIEIYLHNVIIRPWSPTGEPVVP